jgi:hypothetical protein
VDGWCMHRHSINVETNYLAGEGREGRGRSPVAVLQFIAHIHISSSTPFYFYPSHCQQLARFLPLSLSLSPYAHTRTHAHYFPPIASIFILFDLWYLNAFALIIMISTVQYVTKASSTVRAALKEPAKSKALAQEGFVFNRSHWTNGKQGEKSLIDGLNKVGK